jgi:hypothetical protein
MSMAVSGAVSRPRVGGLDTEAIKGYFANALILAGFPLLIGLFLLPGFLAKPPLFNVVLPSMAIIVLSMLFVGIRAFTVTPFDYLFVGWGALAIASHIYANAYLNRSLSDTYLYVNASFILSMALMFRAVFCLILINPAYSTRVFVITVIGFLCATAVIGLMERFGPNAPGAIRLSTLLAPRKEKVLEGAGEGRPTSVFGGPNLLGFADCVLTCFALAWGMTAIRKINYVKVIAVMGLFALASLSALASQSRSTILLMAIFPLIFGIQLRRRASDQANTALFAAMLLVGVIGMLYVFQKNRFDYLTSVSHTGIAHDISYETRLQALSEVARISPEIAILGSGVAQSNNPHIEYTQGYDRYGTLGVDNEWANAFEAFGVWGPLFLIVLFGVWVAQAVRLRGDPRGDAALIAYASLIFLGLILVVSPGAVRVMKYETAGFTFTLLGALAAWRAKPVPVLVTRRQLSSPVAS